MRCLVRSAFLVSLMLASSALAQEPYPSRPVRLIVPFAAGGGPDAQARQFAPKLAEALGGTVIVENRVGAAGTIAAISVAQSPADGYTLLSGSSVHLVLKHLNPAAKYDPLTSFEPVTLTSSGPSVLVVSADFPAKDLKGLEALLRAQPGKLNYGSGGIGTPAHLAPAALLKTLGADAVHVPYKGSVDIVPALMAGQIQFAFPIAGTALPQIRAGKVRALAVTSATRIAQLPDVPTLKEAYGADLLVIDSWGCIWAPRGTPRPVIDKLFAAILKAHRDPALRGFYEQLGSSVRVSASPEEFAAFVRAENAKWGELVRLSGAKVE